MIPALGWRVTNAVLEGGEQTARRPEARAMTEKAGHRSPRPSGMTGFSLGERKLDLGHVRHGRSRQPFAFLGGSDTFMLIGK